MNYCLKALISVGYVKVRNFSRSSSEKDYIYLLTLQGVAEKAAVAVRFLARKQLEYSMLTEEIEELRKAVDELKNS